LLSTASLVFALMLNRRLSHMEIEVQR